MAAPSLDRPTALAFLVLALLLCVIGVVIYQDIEKLSRSTFENQQRYLDSAMFSFRRDFAGTLIDISRQFRPLQGVQTEEALKAELADLYLASDESMVSQLSLFIVRPEEAGSYYRFDTKAEKFDKVQPPSSLQSTPQNVRSLLISRMRAGPMTRIQIVNSRLTLIIPFFSNRRGLGLRGGSPRNPAPPPNHPPRSRRTMPKDSSPVAALILLDLNPFDLRSELFDRLKENYFSGPFLNDFEIAVVGEGETDFLYRSNPERNLEFFEEPERTIPLSRLGGWLTPRDWITPETIFAPTLRQPLLLARHRLGSLKAAVDRQRRYDLFEAFGILLLIGLAAATFLISVRKTRNLARRQMDFVTGVSHELRNPLTALQSAGFNLSRGGVQDTDRIQEYGRMILRESRRLIQMVEQVLGYAGVKESAELFEPESINLGQLLSRILREYQPVMEEQNWRLESEFEENLPLVRGDVKALESCFRNLIDNALKYAGQGKWLRVEAYSARKSGESEVIIAIEDRGEGIPHAELRRIFEPFFRGGVQIDSSVPGTGLGLAIVKRHITNHRGTIEVHSEAGSGTRFVVSLPAL